MKETNLNFDAVIDRRNTNCLKYDFAKKRHMPQDLLPLWIADMDFKTSSFIQEALINQVNHGIFGYSEVQEEYFEILKNWMFNHYNFHIESKWLVKTPGIVFALALAVKAFTNIGDSILIQLPVYYPFKEVIEDNHRIVVSNNLIYGSDNKYYFDFEDFENKIISNNIKLFFLCNPHNPVGRVWSKEELIKLGDICVKYNVIVVSDEIHADFVFKGNHNVLANLKKEFADITITCTSPSKTFNLAGIQISNNFISNPSINKAFRKELDSSGYSQLNVMGLVGCMAAYKNGQKWYEAMFDYVKENIEFTKNYIENNIPSIKMVQHEGTYLVWLDFKGLGLSNEELEDLIINNAKLWLDSGKIFGNCGEGFQRINVACPRSILKEALNRIKNAVNQVIEKNYNNK